MERASVAATGGITVTRVARALRHPGNWMELLKFSVVGAVGYLVNLAVYTALLRGAGLHYLAAGLSLVALVLCIRIMPETRRPNAESTRRSWLNLHRLFRTLQTPTIVAGLGKIVAQAIAVVLVMPLNFIGNKLWSFRR